MPGPKLMDLTTLKVLGVLALTLGLSSCVKRGQNYVLSTTVPPDHLYHCVMLELAGADFTIVNADRASGFVNAKRVEPLPLYDSHTHEIHATVIPAREGTGSVLQITGNAYSRGEAEQILDACTREEAGRGRGSN